VSKRGVEVRAIECAEHYAAANGHRGDKVVAGLVLVGMSIGARLADAAQRELVDGYAEHFPEQERVLDAWAERIGHEAVPHG
jgi:hypothetical protein